MADNDTKRPNDADVTKQEEAVRDLFAQLTESEAPAATTAPATTPTSAAPSWHRTDRVTTEQAAASLVGISGMDDDEPDEDGGEDLPLDLSFLVMNEYEDEEYDDEEGVPAAAPTAPVASQATAVAPQGRRNPFKVFWQAICGNLPLVGDSGSEWLRKCAFWLALVVFSGALTYILYNVWWLPMFTRNMYAEVEQNYHPELVGTVEDNGQYPSKMQLSFQALYDRNNETRGWLSYHAGGNSDFLNIEYPIMYSGDNDKYLTVDFNGNKNKNGALFFDMRSKLDSPDEENKVLIAYGHNMASGQMLAGLNKFIGNVNNARVASTLTMNTLYENAEYKVFAVVMTDEDAQGDYYYNVRRMQFANDEDFMQHVEQLRARSLFDYPVDVQADDELLLLSTCTAPSTAKIDDGRLTVIARKVRPGESPAVNTHAIVKNDDVIMPYAWYTKQELAVHDYYKSMVAVPSTPNGSTTTTVNRPSGTPSDTSGVPTATGDGTTATGTPTPPTGGNGATVIPPTAGGTTAAIAPSGTTATPGTPGSTTVTPPATTTLPASTDTTTAPSGESTTAPSDGNTTAPLDATPTETPSTTVTEPSVPETPTTTAPTEETPAE